MAVANSSAVMVLMTPTKVSLRLSKSRERPVSFPFTLKNKKKIHQSKPGNETGAVDAGCCSRKPLIDNSSGGDWYIVPVGKTLLLQGVAKTAFVPVVLLALHLLRQKPVLYLFSIFG